MTVVDVIIIFVILLSALFGLLRGFVKEAISLAKWILATWIAATFAPKLAPMLPASIESEPVRQAIAFGSLFIAVFILGALVTYLIVQLVKKTGLSGPDRVFGLGFGLLRGALIIVIFVVVGGLTPLPQQDWWQQSVLLERFENIAIWLQDYVPADMNMSFDRGLV